MTLSTNVLTRYDLEGVFAERQGSTTEGSLAVAPPQFTPTLDVRWTHWSEQHVLANDGVDDAFTVKGYEGDPSGGELNMATSTGRVEIYRYGDKVITELQQREFDARNIDVEDAYVTKYSGLAAKHHAANLGLFLSDANNYKSTHVNGSAPNITDPSSDLITAVNGILEKIDDAGVDIGGLQGYVVYHRGIGRSLSMHNQVANYGSLAVKSDNTEQRRTGFADRGAVAAFWANAFEVPLQVWTNAAKIRTSGTVGNAMNDDISIVFSDPDPMGGGFVRTATLSEQFALGMINEYPPQKIKGRGYYVEQCYGFIRPDGDSTQTNAGVYGGLLDGVTG